MKQKTKIRPEELGIVLSDVLATTYFQKIVEHANEFRSIGNFTDSELETLQHLLLMIHCAAISVGMEMTDIDDNNKKIILDSFWNSVSDELRANVSEKESIRFEYNTTAWYPKIREMILEPNTEFGPGSLGPGKTLLLMALPNRDLRNSLRVIRRLMTEFISTSVALTKYAVDCVNMSKFTKSRFSSE
jgi:hypothetical protein